jgi:hypothetical protein
MKRYPALIPYSRFHRSVLFLALLCKKDGPPLKGFPDNVHGKWYYALDFWEDRLLVQFEKEEKHIWTRLYGKRESLDELIELMQAQQAEIGDMLKNMAFAPVNADLLHELGNKLEQYIRHKERIVFQHIQEIYTEEELSEQIT